MDEHQQLLTKVRDSAQKPAAAGSQLTLHLVEKPVIILCCPWLAPDKDNLDSELLLGPRLADSAYAGFLASIPCHQVLLNPLQRTFWQPLANSAVGGALQAVRLHFGVGGAHYTQHLQEGSTTVGVFAPGESLQASTTDGQVTFMGPVNQAVVVTHDVPLCNSVMHVVDAVLVPAAEHEPAAQHSKKTTAGTAEL